MNNISKKRVWKTYDVTKSPDLYFVYGLTRYERGKYLNTWFRGIYQDNYDEIITLKKVDSYTSSRLYHKKYNPIVIFIYNGQMKAQIHSVDDSQFGIWWDGLTKDEYLSIRNDLMQWLNTKPIINGEQFLKKCVELGADKESIDYN